MTESIQIILVLQNMNISSGRSFANTWTLGLKCRKHLYFFRLFFASVKDIILLFHKSFLQRELFLSIIPSSCYFGQKSQIFFFEGGCHLIKFVCILIMFRRVAKRVLVWWNESISKEIRIIRTIEKEILKVPCSH